VTEQRIFPFFLATLLCGIAIFAGLASQGDYATDWLLAARYTARASFAMFLIVYTASALFRLWPGDWTRAIMRHRRQWGLGFALAHSVHLGALGYYNVVIQNMPGLQALAGGGLAYGLMFVMAFTSNNISMKRLGIWWKRIHTVGIHWIWFVFTFSYIGRIFDPERASQGMILTLFCLAALGLRFAARSKTRTGILRV
jgi:methionine sulfoxide reductase heme-binding subunit